MGLPPTIQRQAPPPVPIAPYALVTLHVTPGAGVQDVRPLLERWTGAGQECTAAWAPFAAANRLVAHDDLPFCDPDFAFTGKHRWVAVAEEAPTELHVYAGLCGGAGGALPEIAAVADRAADLIQILGERPLRRGGERLRVRLYGTMFIRGASSGHEYHPPKSYLEIVRDPNTLKEAIPLFAASYGGLFASGPPDRLPVASYLLTLGISVAAYCFLAWMRWRGETNQARWTSMTWPQ